MTENWTLTIKIQGVDFPALKAALQNVFDRILKTKSITECYMWNDFGSTPYSSSTWHYNVSYTCPVEEKIRQLREEANQLESQLRNPT